MKVELIEKGDGTITARFTATSPQESLIMSMATLGPKDSNVGISTETNAYSKKGTVTFNGFSVAVLEMMNAPTTKEK